MPDKLLRTTYSIETILEMYGNMLFRLCLIMLGNSSDAEDVIQESLIKYIQKAPAFKDSEHAKAWLITVATNRCKDILRFKKRHPMIDINEIKEFTKDTSDNYILDLLMTLPDKFRIVLVLYYIEGYKIEDIAPIIRKTKSAVKMRLQKGRRLLRELYQKECM